MSAPLAWLLLVSQTVLSAVLLGGAGLGFAFASEGRHGRELHTLANVLTLAASALAVVPLLLSLVWLARRASGGLAQGGVVLAVPLIACVLGVPTFLALMGAAEAADHSARKRVERDAIAALRAEVAGGSPDARCPLVARDPAATEAEQARCLDVLAELTPTARLARLTPFIDRGLAWHFTPEQRPVFAPSQQARFVTLFFEAQLTAPQVLEDQQARATLFDCLRDVLLWRRLWADDARNAAAAVLPVVRARSAQLASRGDVLESVKGQLEEMERYAAAP
jgi:hypothetical protein